MEGQAWGEFDKGVVEMDTIRYAVYETFVDGGFGGIDVGQL